MALLMTRILANDANNPLATDHLAVATHFLDRSEYFHDISSETLFCTECDAALTQIIWRHLHGYLVARKDPYIVHTHLAGNECMNDMPVFQLDLEGRIGHVFLNLTLHFDNVFLGHTAICSEAQHP